MLLQSANNILVTYLMHLGDLVLTTPFLHVLRKNAPQAKITYLVDEKLADVVCYNPNIDELITIDKKGRDKSVLALWRYAKKMRHNNYDLLINIHPNERTSFLCSCSGAKQKVGAVHKLFTPFFDQVLVLNKKIHAADMYLDILRQLGASDLTHNGLEIYNCSADEKFVDNFLVQENIQVSDKIISFNIGSAVLTKRWSSKRFAQVADYFAQKDYQIIFLGGKMDLPLVKEAVNFMKTKPVLATGKLSLGQLAALMKKMSLVITNDSGPMHVAISQKIPVVAMYGPSSPKLYGPYTELAEIVRSEPPCEDCGDVMKHTCPKMDCMKNLSVEQVIIASERMLLKGGEVVCG